MNRNARGYAIGPPGRFFWGMGLLVALCLVVYFNSLNCSFHYDDPFIKHYVELTRSEQGTHLIREIQNRYFLWFVFAANSYFSQDHPFGYHIINLVVHSCVSIGIFSLFYILIGSSRNHRERGMRFGASLFGAVLFALSPVAVQGVTYIQGRSSSLATLLYIISFMLFFMGRGRSFNRAFFYYSASLVFFVVGIGIKEILLTLPVAIILAVYFFSGLSLRELVKKNLVLLLLLTLLVTAYIVNRGGLHIPDNALISAMAAGNSMGIRLEYLVTQINVIPYYYIKLLVFPFNQNIDPDFPEGIPFFSLSSIAGLLIILTPTLFALIHRRRSVLYFGVCWFFVALVPTSSIVPLPDVAVEHRVYLPAVGLFMAVALVLAGLNLKRRWKPILLIPPLIFSVATMERNRVWLSEYSLWSDAVWKSPHKSRAHNNIGGAFFVEKKEFEKAVESYKEAIRLNPRYLNAHKNLASAYFEAGMLDEAIRKFEHVYFMERDAESRSRTSVHLGDAYTLKGRPKEAVKYFLEAIRLGAADAYTYRRLGAALEASGELDKAADAFLKGLKLDPMNHLLMFHLSEVRFLRKEYGESERLYLKVLKLSPDFEEAMMNLGLTYKKMGRMGPALDWMKKAVRKAPDSEIIRVNLGLLYKEMGRLDESINELNRATRINPKSANTFNEMGTVFFLKSDYADARRAFQRALELKPDFSEARHNLKLAARAEEEQGRR